MLHDSNSRSLYRNGIKYESILGGSILVLSTQSPYTHFRNLLQNVSIFGYRRLYVCERESMKRIWKKGLTPLAKHVNLNYITKRWLEFWEEYITSFKVPNYWMLPRGSTCKKNSLHLACFLVSLCEDKIPTNSAIDLIQQNKNIIRAR